MNSNYFRRKLCALFFILSSLISLPAYSVSMLTLPGEFQPPGIIGGYGDAAEFSWVSHLSPGNTTFFSWNFGGGTDGGIIFDQAQAYKEMADVFTMFNQSTGFFSINSGLSISANNTIDMSNLRMQQSGAIIDIGSGSGFNTLVPYLDDLSLLIDGDNGWSIDNNGMYHLFYNTRGICVDCKMTVHMYGAVVVPLPASLILFLSGLIGLIGFSKNKIK